MFTGGLPMRFGIISDIHGNLVALQAVLNDLDRFDIDRLICLGDVVGYGPDSDACIDLVRDRDAITVAGNHEEALCRPELACRFNTTAREAIDWTRNSFITHRPELLREMGDLPGMVYFGETLMCVHDTPVPSGRGYLLGAHEAAHAFAGVDARICFVGHTHVPVAFRGPGRQVKTTTLVKPSCVDTLRPEHTPKFFLDGASRWIINPGSVGQPRDGDVRSAYGILDLESASFEWRRVSYDIAYAQERAQAAGLPDSTVRRLAMGA